MVTIALVTGAVCMTQETTMVVLMDSGHKDDEDKYGTDDEDDHDDGVCVPSPPQMGSLMVSVVDALAFDSHKQGRTVNILRPSFQVSGAVFCCSTRARALDFHS